MILPPNFVYAEANDNSGSFGGPYVNPIQNLRTLPLNPGHKRHRLYFYSEIYPNVVFGAPALAAFQLVFRFQGNPVATYQFIATQLITPTQASIPSIQIANNQAPNGISLVSNFPLKTTDLLPPTSFTTRADQVVLSLVDTILLQQYRVFFGILSN